MGTQIPKAPLVSAKNLPLGRQSFAVPNLSAALSGLFQPMVLQVVQTILIDGYSKEVEPKTVLVKGVRQPFTAQELSLRPEGDRQWKWEKMHVDTAFILSVNDKFYFDGTPYRVKEKNDFKEYGFVEYNIVQDYEDSSDLPTANDGGVNS